MSDRRISIVDRFPKAARRWSRLAVLLSLLAVLGLALASCGGKERPQGDAASGTGPLVTAASQPVDAVKILVDQAGLYQVSAEQLQTAGLDLSNGAGAMSLTVAGEPVAFAWDAEGTAPGLTFYGQPRQSRYGRQNVYWLSRSQEETSQGLALSGRLLTPADEPSEPAVNSFQDTVRLEQSVQYLSQTPEDTDHWLWQPIYAPGAYTVTFDLPGWAGGDGALNVSLWGNTQDFKNPDHHVVLRLNGQQVADSSWDDKGWRTVSADAPASALKAAGNELVVELPGDTGAVVDVAYLDYVEIAYPRQLLADAGAIRFSLPAGQPVAVSGFPSDQVLLWDVTEPARPQPLSGFAVTKQDNGYRVSFQDAGVTGQRDYVAAAPEARSAPVAIRPAAGRDLRDSTAGADYIAVTYPGFQEALQPLLEHRRSQGLRVEAATIDEVYDTFSYGLPDPAAMREYLRYARDHWPEPAPQFVLLVGDASYDYQGFLPDSTPNYVPTYLLTTHFVGETASDNWFVSLNESDDRPSLAIGRIPAQTAEQVAAVVAKTLAYEQAPVSADWLNRALFVADNKQASFQDMTEALAADFLPESYSVEKVYLGQSQDPEREIMESLRQGVGLVTYVGHGSMNVWAQEKIFQTQDVASLDNASALPFMMTMTCLVGYFHHPQNTSMGEELLFKPAGGVVAALVPTSESLASDQRPLAEKVYSYLFDDQLTLGEAVMRAKQDLPAETDAAQDVIETFTLLGDPALRLRQPG